ncbi:MAG TPA: ABC transporter substrate-binding protein [Bryobacteraceae bacterium]|nr:ABC transporter substrate-binding protein [Bryobacteraceae bacterium]
MSSRWFVGHNVRRLLSASTVAPLLLLAGLAAAATRPHYGGVLRVEMRDSVETADPPQAGASGPARRFAELDGAFTITHWEPGVRATYTADDNAKGGRPFLDSVEVRMARPLRDQSIDLELGKADIVQLGPNEIRRAPPGRKLWTSAPVRLIAVVFGPRISDPRVRQSLALAVDRAAIHDVLLQRQGEISGGLLPAWLSGYAFLFPAAADIAKARSLVAGLPAPARAFSLGYDPQSPTSRPIAERIALNARDAGLLVSVGPTGANSDAHLAEVHLSTSDPAAALSEVAAALGLPEPPRADSPEALYAAEYSLLDGFRAVPLFYLPDVYAVSPRVRTWGGPGLTPLGEWRFENVWVEESSP